MTRARLRLGDEELAQFSVELCGVVEHVGEAKRLPAEQVSAGLEETIARAAIADDAKQYGEPVRSDLILAF